MKATLILVVWRVLLLCCFQFQAAIGQVMEVDTGSQSTYIPPAPKKYSVGLDVFKNIPFWLRGGQAPLLDDYGTQHNRLIMEVVLRKENRTTADWTGTLGYTQLHILFDPQAQVLEQQHVKGWYVKAGRERSIYESTEKARLGILVISTFCQYRTDLRFPGPAFGDYTQQHLSNNMGVGVEPYFAYDFFPESRWSLRWVTRLSFHQRLSGEGLTSYYPGVGNAVSKYNFSISGGTTLQLHYRFHAR